MTAHALARVNVVLSFVGLFIASMLSIAKVLHLELPCGIGSGCDMVTQDPRSQVFGVPIAYFGVVAYALLALVTTARLHAPRDPEALHAFGYAMSALGVLASIALTVFSVAKIHAVCTWCIGSAFTMSLLFASHALAAMRPSPPPVRISVLDAALPLLLFVGFGTALLGSADRLEEQAKGVRVNRRELNRLSDQELLPPDAHICGPGDAKATIVMFGDLTCPVCQEAFGRLRKLMATRRDFKFAFRHLPLKIHSLARPAALLSEMAAEHGQFWEFASDCYASDASSVEELISIASRHGVPPAEARRRLPDPTDEAARRLGHDAVITKKLDLYSTPSVFVVDPEFEPEPIASTGVPEILNDIAAQRGAPDPPPSSHKGLKRA